MLENKDDIPFDELEKQLIEEAETSEERNDLKKRIHTAKIKRIEKMAEMEVWNKTIKI